MIPRDVQDVNGVLIAIKDPIPRRDQVEIDANAVVRIELGGAKWLGTLAHFERLYVAMTAVRAELNAMI